VTGAIGPGRLLLVTVDAARGAATERIERALIERMGVSETRRLHPGALVVHADASAAQVRDWALDADAAARVFVVEFERWSCAGDFDMAWLTRRGH
jgi:hypothetical protein